MNGRVLVIDDEKLSRISLERFLRESGWEVESFPSAYPAMERLEAADWDVVLSDLRMPGMDGLQVLREVRRIRPETGVILITAYGTVEGAVAAMKEGAVDYVTKPFQLDEIAVRLERALRMREMYRETIELRRRLATQDRYHRLVGKSAAMRGVFEKISTIADNPCTVLIVGETGTGKELVAEAIHAQSQRRQGPLVKVSCFALSREIIESELFGHEKGAFTGAIQQKRGRFELADGGTILLDDIEDVPLEYQTKLLRVIQERNFERVGGEKTISVDVRIIAATKRDPRQMAAEGRFRQDLLYRLLGAIIEIPPLRSRQEDIVPLVGHFLAKYGDGKACKQFSPKALDCLIRYHWPGNVRELEHVVEQSVAMCSGPAVEEHHLPKYLLEDSEGKDVVSLHLQGRSHVNLPAVVDEVESTCIRWALARTNGHQGQAADLLGLPRTTLRDRMLNLFPPADQDGPGPVAGAGK